MIDTPHFNILFNTFWNETYTITLSFVNWPLSTMLNSFSAFHGLAIKLIHVLSIGIQNQNHSYKQC